MFGKNPVLSTKKGDGSYLEVHKIFATFQGEGPFTGHAAVFIRLSGCNLTCKFCDTEFDIFDEMSIADIIRQINLLAVNKEGKRVCNLIVITGGEPLRQPIAKLCRLLIDDNFKVQIETNGTLFQDLPEEVYIICSPKNSGSGYKTIRSDLLPRINAFKFLISENIENYQQVGQVGQEQFNIPVYIQPIDEYDEAKNQANRKRVLKLAAENGYILSLQTHKVWNIE